MAQESGALGASEYVTVEIYDQLYHLSGQDPGAHSRAGRLRRREDARRGRPGQNGRLTARGRAGRAEPCR